MAHLKLAGMYTIVALYEWVAQIVYAELLKSLQC